MSTDDGLTWSTPVKISQTPLNANALKEQAFLPSVAVGDGTVAVTYYDLRNDDDTGESWRTIGLFSAPATAPIR
jgi:hypothetical protein